MRRLVLTCILQFGRYAVLPFVPLAGVLLTAWLMTLDGHPLMALVTAPIVFCAVPALAALGFGLLLVPPPKDSNPELGADAAARLWAMWKELDPDFARARHSLRIDSEFNASIWESRFAGLFGRRLTMTVGLPLLMILDERALRAVIAHEVAHAELQHTSGGDNLRAFLLASQSILHHADPDRTVTGRVARILLSSLHAWLDKEYLVLSREHELGADGRAAERIGRGEMARALVIMDGARTRLNELIFDPLEKELLGAIRVPQPPLQRICDQLPDIRAIAPLMAAATAGLQKTEKADATHPPFPKRLSALGFREIPAISDLAEPALGRALTDDDARTFMTRFDNEWCKQARTRVDVGR